LALFSFFERSPNAARPNRKKKTEKKEVSRNTRKVNKNKNKKQKTKTKTKTKTKKETGKNKA